MRDMLSKLLCDSAHNNPNMIVLSGDHGYALFDRIRSDHPKQFINVGVAEQGMVGYAAGLAKVGFFPIVYGLASFVPIRVLEQIKLDLCLTSVPTIILGDGAGVVYSTLGASHQCAEDVACLRPLPNIRIYSPCDSAELKVCFAEGLSYAGPSYIRIGKSDRPEVHKDVLKNTDPRFTFTSSKTGVCLVATGSMTYIADVIARKHGFSSITVPRLKPFDAVLSQLMEGFDKVFVIEEHSRYGGLGSCVAELLCETMGPATPQLRVLSLKDKFARHCGGYQYALSEHNLADEQVEEEVLRSI